MSWRILLSAWLVLGLLLLADAASATCRDERIDLRGSWGNARFTVEVADTADARAQGLMHRPSMPRGAGMLFVYEAPATVSFWMRNTLIPLDMIFADEAGRVTRVHENARPLDETPIPGGDGVQFVLEINGGLSSQLGIAPGTEMRHPAIAPPDGAAWPCG